MPMIVWSKPNIAGNNICEYLFKEYGISGSGKNKINFFETDKNVLNFAYTDKERSRETDRKTDYLIVPSTHRSEKNLRSFTVHVPGNWGNADFGGEPETLNWAYASFMKTVLLKIKDNYDKLFTGEAQDQIISYEVDHHGPTLSDPIPIVFVEIGSTEKEWNDQNAIKLIGDSIIQAIDSVHDEQPYFGIGGGHYAPRFTSLLFKEGLAFGHMLPKYREHSFIERMIQQAIEKNKEGPARVIIDWKGLASEFREKTVKILDDLGVEWEKKR